MNGPDSTAVRVALWRAVHMLRDAPPFVLEDALGLDLIQPAEGWLDQPDMADRFSKNWRASIVGRARLVEDLVISELGEGIRQYVLLGAGLDTFGLRQPLAEQGLRIYEVDEPVTQEWKRQRLDELQLDPPSNLHYAPVDFESGQSWVEALEHAGFDPSSPAVVASMGVTQYIGRDATRSTMRLVAGLAVRTLFVSTFIVPVDLIDPAELKVRKTTEEGASATGHPWIGVYSPQEFITLAMEAGLEPSHVTARDLTERYFSDRTDGLRPASSEDILVARVPDARSR